MRTNTSAAELRGVKKEYPGFTLGPIDLTIPTGTIVGLVGENGAGKTTLLKLLTGVNAPDAGQLVLLGSAPDDLATRSEIAVVFEDAYFYESMTAAQIGRSLAGIFGRRWDDVRYQKLLETFTLKPTQKIKEYSRGMRMKLSLASALAHDPKLLILDEATSGLDPVMRSEILDIFLEFIQDEGHTVLISSHITSDLEQVADSVAYLHAGKLLFHENKDALMAEYGLLRCSASDLEKVPSARIIHTHRGSFGCETLVKGRDAVRALLPGAVCDPAGIDDIMRFYYGRDAE